MEYWRNLLLNNSKKNGNYSVTATNGITSLTDSYTINDIMEGGFPLLSYNTYMQPPNGGITGKDKLYIMDLSKNSGDPHAYNATQYRLEIYNRWGTGSDEGYFRLIEGESCTGFDNWSINWDGCDQAGTIVPDGQYNWRLYLKNCEYTNWTQVKFRTTYNAKCNCLSYFYFLGARLWCIEWEGCWNEEVLTHGRSIVTKDG